jgi:hypothetical protein
MSDLLKAAYNAWTDLNDREARWTELMERVGIKIQSNSSDAFARSLSEPFQVNRRIAGFEDFAADVARGIEPAQPVRSALYHAYASPNVLECEGGKLKAFPTEKEIQAVENYVYGVRPPSMSELHGTGRHELAIGVFAYEYRPAAQTVHRQHADLCFSRTGIARVGTEKAEYLEHARGYLPNVSLHEAEFNARLKPDDDNVIRVSPCRYAAFVAARLRGDQKGFGPLRFRKEKTSDRSASDAGKTDADRFFWVPLHKLFNGPECLQGLDLSIEFEHLHVNEKLRRLHMIMRAKGFDTGDFSQKQLDNPPFRFTDDIADLVVIDDSKGCVFVMPHRHPLVQIAESDAGKPGTSAGADNQPITFKVPRIPKMYYTSFWMEPGDDTNRPCPEFVYSRVGDVGGKIQNLDDGIDIVLTGGFDAVHYKDFTGDGYIKASCNQLPLPSLPAYSIIAPPDFFPLVSQREVAEWFEGLKPRLRNLIWSANGVNPAPLSDMRQPANLQIERAGFNKDDDTISAIVGTLSGKFAISASAGARKRMASSRVCTSSGLPDNAAGLFAPGWDTSQDLQDDISHLSAYGLGSPFPEDMKLCAALSAYWPAATPDTARFYPQASLRSTTPLPDDFAGWDEVPLPALSKGVTDEYEYASLGYVDYVKTAATGHFHVGRLARITLEQFTDWTLIMANVHLALKADTPAAAARWYVPRFRRAQGDEEELREGSQQTRTNLNPAKTYRIELFTGLQLNSTPKNSRNVRVRVKEKRLAYADTQTVIIRDSDGQWTSFIDDKH